MPAASASRTRVGSPPSPRPVSISPACSAIDSPTCGRVRVSSRSVAEPLGSVGALPNLLTLFRVGLVPIVVLALFWPTPAGRVLAAGLFFVACVTDFLDGWLARRHGITAL